MAAAVLLTIAFAFPNPDGSRLLATAKLDRPAALQTALCSGGQRVAVEFERAQPEGRNSTRRQTSDNFADTSGNVFRVVGASVGAGATCLVADDAFLTGTTQIALARPRAGTPCPRDWYPSFQAAKSRPVVACWPVAGGNAGVHVAVIEFARWLSQALASLAVIDGDRHIFVDYPAEFHGPGADLWRADDGGDVHADGFDVIFLLRRGPAYVLGLDWRGAEGSALSVLTAEDGDRFSEVLQDFWYRSPL